MEKLKVTVVGEFTEEHAKRVLMTSYRIWKWHLQEQAKLSTDEALNCKTDPLYTVNLDKTAD